MEPLETVGLYELSLTESDDLRKGKELLQVDLKYSPHFSVLIEYLFVHFVNNLDISLKSKFRVQHIGRISMLSIYLT